MQAESLALIGSLAVLGIHTLAVGMDCRRCRLALPLLQRHAWRLKSLRHLSALDEAALPPMTLMLVIRDQADQAVALIRRMMALKYPQVEYLVINDGSEDRSLHLLQEQLGLHPVPRFPVAELTGKPVRGVYQSEDSPRLWVIDKEPGGVADALNAGLNFCQTPLVGVLSARLQPSDDALIQATRPFLEQAQTWAVSGRVRPSQDGRPRSLPESAWGRLQSLMVQRDELLDAVLDSAAGCFAGLSADLCVLRRASLVEAGGFATRSQDFMAETAVRLYRVAKIQGDQMRLAFIPDTLGWLPALGTPDQVRAQIRESQARACLIYSAGKLVPRRDRLIWRKLALPLIHLLTLLSVAPLALFAPIWLWVWLVAILTPATVWQLVLLLGERTDQRYGPAELQAMQRSVWSLPLRALPRITLWQLAAWKPPPEAQRESSSAKVTTSPLKVDSRK